MHKWDRQQVILRRLRAGGFVGLAELAALTEASSATLRRDVARLAVAGQLRRVHGGVRSPDMDHAPQVGSRAIGIRVGLHAAEKRRLARAAAALCRDGESIIINAGSTTRLMAEYLRHRRLQILTNSYLIAQELIATSENRVIVPGGEIYRDQGIILSPFEHDAAQSFTDARMFMSCFAITAMGIIEDDPLVARAETKLLSRAEALVVIADASKFEARGSMVVCPLQRVHTLITGASAPADVLDHIRSAGVTVVTIGDDAVPPEEALAAVEM
jgi:DeoR family ulaG and ulaABCDEF operon transcriptional repressor